jgi:hypothetical protein
MVILFLIFHKDQQLDSSHANPFESLSGASTEKRRKATCVSILDSIKLETGLSSALWSNKHDLKLYMRVVDRVPNFLDEVREKTALTILNNCVDGSGPL